MEGINRLAHEIGVLLIFGVCIAGAIAIATRTRRALKWPEWVAWPIGIGAFVALVYLANLAGQANFTDD